MHQPHQFDYTTLMYIVIIFIAVYIIFLIINPTIEKIGNVSNEDVEIATQIADYINSTDNDFVNYINFLTSIGNTNLNIISVDVFYEFKTLKKQNKLSIQNILREMSKEVAEKKQ
jgi:predicted PurR-regulated permease PerM